MPAAQGAPHPWGSRRRRCRQWAGGGRLQAPALLGRVPRRNTRQDHRVHPLQGSFENKTGEIIQAQCYVISLRWYSYWEISMGKRDFFPFSPLILIPNITFRGSSLTISKKRPYERIQM